MLTIVKHFLANIVLYKIPKNYLCAFLLMALIASASRLAPPISSPSTPSSAINSAAFSAFADPPYSTATPAPNALCSALCMVVMSLGLGFFLCLLPRRVRRLWRNLRLFLGGWRFLAFLARILPLCRFRARFGFRLRRALWIALPLLPPRIFWR